MAQAKKKKKAAVGDKLVNEIVGISLLGIAVYMMWLIFQAQKVTGSMSDSLGWIGAFVFRSMDSLMGGGKWIFPILLLLCGLTFITSRVRFTPQQTIGLLVGALIILVLLHMKIVAQEHTIKLGWTGLGGGVIGGSCAWLLHKAFGSIGAYITLAILAVIDALVITKGALLRWLQLLAVHSGSGFGRFKELVKGFVFVEVDEEEAAREKKPKKPRRKKTEAAASEKPIIINNLQEIQEEIAQNKQIMAREEEKAADISEESSVAPDDKEAFKPNLNRDAEYAFPAIELMEQISTGQSSVTEGEITEKVELLQETLNDFGVKGKIVGVSVGPAITRYEFQPAPGVKVSKIVNLSDDIALSLAAAGVRIEAPIPGKAAVGIEVPNKEVSMVGMRDLLESAAFQEGKSKLTVALGLSLIHI